MKRRFGKNSKAGIGCGYLIALGIGTMLLWMLNTFLITSFLKNNRFVIDLLQQLPSTSETSSEIQYIQAITVVCPMILTLLEFWLFDYFVDLSRRKSGELVQLEKE